MTAHETPRLSGLSVRAFARPRGMLGRLGGVTMARGNAAAQREIAALLEIRPGDRVLEIGYGPGEMMRLLAGHTSAAMVAGVDPSPVMQAMARRRCAAYVAVGRAGPRAGTATATGMPDRSFDHVVSVNNVLFWGDIRAGFAELHRVLRPEGSAVVAFHSRSAPSRIKRRIGLSDDAAERIAAAMGAVFGEAKRHDLEHVVAFTAVRGPCEAVTPPRAP